ncbi:hypothetical protein [Altererythrobacter aquiaggeris]|uniref:hypothetical protein n=1 Tax=Aestuarierythrobacter aquiaggeris TaxID=1898396 RepID=UPI00301A6D4A
MTLITVLAAAMLAQAAPSAADQVDVAYVQLAADQNAIALEHLEARVANQPADPAALINLGIAYARDGRTAQARQMFLAALTSSERFQLETAAGNWVDSRWLARNAIAMLDTQANGSGPQFASAK